MVLEIPIIRWGKTYDSLEQSPVVHFETGETLAKVHQANGGLVKLDQRQAKRAREILRQFSIPDLIQKCQQAAEYFISAELPLGNSTQTPEDFCRMQSATTGLPEKMCADNMHKNVFVLKQMEPILLALTRGLPWDILSTGYGQEERGVMLSYQANAPVLGMVLPSNSPGVHTLWLPVIPLQMGLVIKPGSQEPWTAYRMFSAFTQAGIPAEVFSIYPGSSEVGAAILSTCQRSMIFGGATTIEQYAGNPQVQVHGPGYSKIIIGDDYIDRWEDYLDLMVDSVLLNSGRSCINCSGIWVSRHSQEIAEALAKRLAQVKPLPASDPQAALAAFTVPGVAAAIDEQIDQKCEVPGVTEMTAKHRSGPRLIQKERHDFLLPTVVHCQNPEPELANSEYMFPFVSVVECPEAAMVKTIGKTLVCSALTENVSFSQELLEATQIDRLNIGLVKTNQINWLQPHEGNLIDFLFRNRAFQNSPPPAHA